MFSVKESVDGFSRKKLSSDQKTHFQPSQNHSWAKAFQVFFQFLSQKGLFGPPVWTKLKRLFIICLLSLPRHKVNLHGQSFGPFLELCSLLPTPWKIPCLPALWILMRRLDLGLYVRLWFLLNLSETHNSWSLVRLKRKLYTLLLWTERALNWNGNQHFGRKSFPSANSKWVIYLTQEMSHSFAEEGNGVFLLL